MKTTFSCRGADYWTRRDLLRVGSLSLLGMSLGQYLEVKSLLAAGGGNVEKKAKAQACILLLLEGGPSQMDTWDPKPTSGFEPIGTNVSGIQISELFPRVARHMDKLAVIRSMRSEEIDHPEATYYAITGHRPTPAMEFPSVGSIISKELGPLNTVPPYVTVPELIELHQPFFRSAFLGAEFDPMTIPLASSNQGRAITEAIQEKEFQLPYLSLPKSVSAERIQNRRGLLKIVDQSYRRKMELAPHLKMDKFSEQALRMVLAQEVRQAFDLSQESEKTKDAYGRHTFGQSALLARRLVEAGSRFVTAAGYGHGGWDTHGDNDKQLRDELAPPLDQVLSTLLQDLEQRGLLDSTIVLVMGEFGRTPDINPRNGRDHWPHCWSLLVGGGGIRGGQVIGASDEKAAYVAEREVTIGDLFATVYKSFGIDWTKEYMSPIGRPVKIANSIDDKTGVPIAELV